MGRYRPTRRTFVLQFGGEDEFDGLEVKCRPPTVGEALNNYDLSWFGDKSLTDAEAAAKLLELYTLFVSRLLEWNLDDVDTGEPTPATVEGMMSLDHDFGFSIVRAWLFRTSGVSAPLDDDSNTGSALVDESLIPMSGAPAARAS